MTEIDDCQMPKFPYTVVFVHFPKNFEVRMKKFSLENLAAELAALIPQKLSDSGAKESIQKILEIGIQKLDLVSREEFDAQVKVLQRTREKLDMLEEKLKNFE
jgi:ubiquinone biosynthesis accessory factor UbiK